MIAGNIKAKNTNPIDRIILADKDFTALTIVFLLTLNMISPPKLQLIYL